jgi:outer membrane biosynthesis protein TonB
MGEGGMNMKKILKQSIFALLIGSVLALNGLAQSAKVSPGSVKILYGFAQDQKKPEQEKTPEKPKEKEKEPKKDEKPKEEKKKP